MKKTFKAWPLSGVAAAIGIAATAFVSCAHGSGGQTPAPAPAPAFTYTISYDGDGNTGGAAPASQTKTYGQPLVLQGGGDMTNSGWYFAGWTAWHGEPDEYVPEGEPVFAGGASLNEDLAGEAGAEVTLYACWSEREPQAIIYHLNGGSGVTDSVYTGAVTVALRLSAEKTGYTFAGWYDNEALAGNPVTEIPEGSAGTKEFWAKWGK